MLHFIRWCILPQLRRWHVWLEEHVPCFQAVALSSARSTMSETMVGRSERRWTGGRSRLRFQSSRQGPTQMLNQAASQEREEQPGERAAALATSAERCESVWAAHFHLRRLQGDRKSPNHRVREARVGPEWAELASGTIRTEVVRPSQSKLPFV